MRSQDSDLVAAGARILLMPHLSGHEKMISKTATNPTTFVFFLTDKTWSRGSGLGDCLAITDDTRCNRDGRWAH
jgi:hypothetical protein